MRPCCQTKQTRGEFLESKLKNFVAYLAPFAPDANTKDTLANYSTLVSALPLLVHLKAAGVDAAAAKLNEAFPTSDKAKIAAYMHMFNDLTS